MKTVEPYILLPLLFTIMTNVYFTRISSRHVCHR